MHDANGYDFFPGAEFDFMSHYLRGTPEHSAAPFSYRLQPTGPYLAATQWPPTGTRFTRFYLHAAGGVAEPATGAPTAGSLGPARPTDAGSDSYVTNPLAGWSMAFNSYGTIAASPFVPTDQPLAEPDGPTWRTAPGSRPQRIVGPNQRHPVASS